MFNTIVLLIFLACLVGFLFFTKSGKRLRLRASGTAVSYTHLDVYKRQDFIVNQFNEQMDKTVMEAKGEIEAFYQNKVNTIASAALVEHRDELKRLDNPVEISEDNNVK